jgi:hypothetical protein
MISAPTGLGSSLPFALAIVALLVWGVLVPLQLVIAL